MRQKFKDRLAYGARDLPCHLVLGRDCRASGRSIYQTYCQSAAPCSEKATEQTLRDRWCCEEGAYYLTYSETLPAVHLLR